MAIYYGCPDKDYPVGGIRVIYRHVDLLTRNGFDAFVLHHYFPFRCTWFENATPVAHEVRYPDLSHSFSARAGRRALRAVGRRRAIDPLPALELGADDVLVVPEVMPGMARKWPGVPKAVFDQNAYLTLAVFPLDVDPADVIYNRQDVLGTIVVSEDNRGYLETLFPKLKIHRIHYGIDPALFSFKADKKRQIAYMPRKNLQDIHQVILRLRLAGKLERWGVVEIDDRTEAETASILRDSAVFLSSGHPEGFGLPAAEAMLAGCVVVGYHGYGGREFLTNELGFPIDVGDVVSFADTLTEVLESLETRPEALASRRERASRFIADNYSLEREERDVLAVWTELIGEPH